VVRNWLLGLGVLTFTALAYLPATLEAPRDEKGFVWDDRALILMDTQIKTPGNPARIFARDFFGFSDDASKYGYYRPAVTLTYLLDWRLHHTDARGYRLTNLAWHLLSVGLLFLLLLRLPGVPSWAAGVGAALFGAHPIHVESVAWIAGRTDVVCAALLLAALLAWQTYLARNVERLRGHDAKRRGRVCLFAAAAFFFLSLLTKEMGALFLAAAPALAYYLAAAQTKGRFGRLKWETALFALIFGGYLILRLAVAGVTFDNPSRDHTLWKAVATFPGAFAVYLGKLLLPLRQSAYYVHPYVTHPFSPTGILGLTVLAAFLAGLIFARRRVPAAAWTLAVFLLSFGPLANWVRISAPADMGFPMAERFLYIPSAFLSALLAVLLGRLPTRRGLPLIIGSVGLALALAAAAATTYAATRWNNEIGVYEHALAQNDQAPAIWANLGAAYRRDGRLAEALEALHRAMAINAQTESADPVDLFNNLGTTLATMRRYEEALAAFEEALSFGRKTELLHYNRGLALQMLGRLDRASEAYRASLAVNPDLAPSKAAMAQVEAGMRAQDLHRQRRFAAAAAELEQVLKNDPTEPNALDGLADILRRQGQLERAAQLLQASLAIRPNYIPALVSLGKIELQQGHADQAAVMFRRAALIRPRDKRLQGYLEQAETAGNSAAASPSEEP